MTQQFVTSKIFRIATAICALFIIAKSASAQQLSTYEQKRYNLAKETINKMGDQLGYEKDGFLALVALNIAGETMANGDFKSKLEEMYYIEELITLAGTGSSSFYGDDIARNLTYSYRLKDVYYSWKEQRKAIDKTRTQADIDREYKIKPTTGTIDQMISLVRIEFGKWAKRGIYEKTVDYQNRLNTYGIAKFDSICNVIIGKDLWRTSPAYKVIEEHYDPDKEQYLATLAYGDDSYKGKISLTCEISPDKAPYYRIGDVTKMRVDGKWLVPTTSEGVRYNRDGHIDVYMKTTFTTNAATIPLRICFKDIKFGYSEISDELKNHCFSNEEYDANLQAKYDNLYTQKEELKEKLKHIKSISFSDDWRGEFLDWFEHFIKYETPHSYGLSCSYIINFLNEDYNESKQTFKKSNDAYEKELHNISEILNSAEDECYNRETTKFLTNIGYKKEFPIIKKVSFSKKDGNQIIFDVPKTGEVQGLFYRATMKKSNGRPYNGAETKHIFGTDDGKLVLYRRTNNNILLIINLHEIYTLSPKVQQQLKKHGILEDNHYYYKDKVKIRTNKGGSINETTIMLN
jgi:hypothetical protein